MSTYINNQDTKHKELLAYWLKDYVRFLSKESTFDPRKLIRYKRGSIVKAHLGYRIGSEEGGLHYAVVMDMHNAQSSQTVTIVPLTSVKPTTDLSRLHSTRVYLGDEVYQRLQAEIDRANSEIATALSALAGWDTRTEGHTLTLDTIVEQMEKVTSTASHLTRMQKEIAKMKRGSIALVDQITTISKIRIYDPLYPHDTLAKIRLSPEALDKLDNKIKSLYTFCK